MPDRSNTTASHWQPTVRLYFGSAKPVEQGGKVLEAYGEFLP
jgi:hypothetical protein